MYEPDAPRHPVLTRGRVVPGRGELHIRVDCDRCPARPAGWDGSPVRDACDDCVVAYLLARDADDAVVHDMCEERALRLLTRAGLVGAVVGRMDHAEAERRFATG